MPDSRTPIRGQSATFSVNGAKRGDAVLLLYPGELTAVNTRSIGTWVYVLVPAVYLAVWFFLMEQRHAHLVTALTARGREVYIAAETITVMPWATSGEI